MSPRDLVKREFRRILIIKPSSFGDVIHALPVLNGLRHRYPAARISWLVANSCAGLLEGHPALDEIIRFDRKRYGHLGRSFRVTVEFMDFVHALRARKFDLVLDLQGLFRSGFLALASGAAVRLGFGSAREFAWMFYTHRVDIRRRNMHAVDRNYLFARLLGFADVPIEFHLPIRPEARAGAARLLRTAGLAPGTPYALMAPGTRWETKLWPAGHFAETARHIRAEHGLHIVLAGAPDEVELAEHVASLIGEGVTSLAGRTTPTELTALVDGAALVVMHDSGPMHLASALGKPMVAIYGPTSPLRTGPYGREDAIARLILPCSPCYLKRVADCPHQHRCLRELTPDMIATRVDRLLEVPV